jgi:ADP-ribosylglycohydrolase
MRYSRLREFLRGVALGDSLGMLPENLDRSQVARMFGDKISQKMPFGRGFVSDETEQALLTIRAMGRQQQTLLPLKPSLRWELVAWLATLPPGIGSSTLISILKLAFKSRTQLAYRHRLGVASSGNGPLLRAAAVGFLLDDVRRPGNARGFTQVTSQTTLMTHATLDALVCSVTTAMVFNAAHTASIQGKPFSKDIFRDSASFAGACIGISDDYGWHAQLRENVSSLNPAFDVIDLVANRGITLEEGLSRIGCGDGVSGYIRDTMLAARHPDDLNAAADAAIRSGGDTDSVAALACGLVAVIAEDSQDFSRLKLWRDPYGLARQKPPSSKELLVTITSNRHWFGMLVEHLSLATLFAIPFLGRRTWIRLGFGKSGR